MEMARIIFDDKKFDETVHHPTALPDDGNCHFIFKDDGTVRGNPLCCIAFKAQTSDGKVVQCQTVVTMGILNSVFAAARGRYPQLIN